MSAVALHARGLRVRLGQGVQARSALAGIDLDVRAARWTSVVGPNGAGKSTLLRALAGLQPLQQGAVELLGRPLGHWGRRERARTLGWLAQSGAAALSADDLSVFDVALLGRLPHLGWLSAPSAADLAAVERALRQTQAWDWRARPLGALSGGERQRVLLARLLALEAPVLLMDEPLLNLDPPHQADWIALVRALVATGRTVVSVLHEISTALLADELVLLQHGQVQFAGPCHDPNGHAALLRVFEQRLEIVAVGGRWVALPALPSALHTPSLSACKPCLPHP
ncbi:MAG: ABC transporter ATP-binding protein [Pseudomonadota bacterium]|jgi:iron complex transport system ATP-binding protein